MGKIISEEGYSSPEERTHWLERSEARKDAVQTQPAALKTKSAHRVS